MQPTAPTNPNRRAKLAEGPVGRTLLKLGRAGDAIEPLAKATRIDPENTAAHRDLGALGLNSARRGIEFLLGTQNTDGGWGAAAGLESTAEETALAVDALWTGPGIDGEAMVAAARGACFLAERVEAGELRKSSPIGLYFARLWYSECLYPLIWTVGALGRILATGAAREAAANRSNCGV